MSSDESKPGTEKTECHVFQGEVEVYGQTEELGRFSERELDELVFLPASACQVCKIAIGDPVIIAGQESVIVRRAWASNVKSLASIGLTRQTKELNNIRGQVRVKKAHSPVDIAKEIFIDRTGKHSASAVTTELEVLLKCCNEQRILLVGNRISVPYYGKHLTFKVLKISTGSSEYDTPPCATTDSLESIRLFKAEYQTKWTVHETKKPSAEIKTHTENIGGYEDLIEELKDVLDISLGKYNTIQGFSVNKALLLHGTPGVGKSQIAKALIAQSTVKSFVVHSSDIYAKSAGETEKRLTDIFEQAKQNAPCIILLEDIDALCPRRSSSSTEHERRVLSQLTSLLDDVQGSNNSVVLLATTSKLDLVDSSLRRPGRIDREFEVPVPTPSTRVAIIKTLLSKLPNSLSQEEVWKVARVTHGFVAADLYGLCSQGFVNAVKRLHKSEELVNPDEVRVTLQDITRALSITKPSAMKEVLVEVPDVRWTDIGGQHELKLKLKQAVEWPLRHPEAFVRMGITPPKGVLMFGPPGCSKTMIAKALATESGLNFLSIKGPELFSKWVGESEKAVREVFRKARQVAPSIIFIDEIDAIGGERSSTENSSGSNVQERVLAQLLTELDGVTELGDVTVVAATNRPDKIDKALLRPGRLDRIIYVRLPDYKTRQEIFDIKLKRMPVAEDVNVQDLVELTEGYTGAEIQAICHEAAINALEEDLNAEIITKTHFKAALSIVTPRTPTWLINLYDDYVNNARAQ